MTDIIYLTDVSLITCVVADGTADDILLAVRDLGARGAIVSHGRGWGTRERFGALGVAVETQRDIVSILVSSDQQDILFDAIYRAGNLDKPGRGVVFITPLDKAATYVPKAVRERLDMDAGDRA